MAVSLKNPISEIENQYSKKNIPNFRTGDTLKVHAKIVEGNKERIQVFEGVVIKKQGRNGLSSTFTVRKVSYNVGVERTFMLHSPRIDKIEVMTKGVVRRSRLFYLRPLRGKASKIKTQFQSSIGNTSSEAAETPATESAAAE